MNKKIDFANPRQTMATHGKTFFFASKLLTQKTIKKVSLLYALCRHIDDCADEMERNEGVKHLAEIIFILLNKKKPNDQMGKIITQLTSYGVKENDLLVLVQGALLDLQQKKIFNNNDLYLYCHHVAGIVGIMMCPLLNITKPKAVSYANSLGIAMQLTNICRDILEDAQKGRCYLPQNKLKDKTISISDMAQKGETPEQLKILIREYLKMADRHYNLAYEGLAYIPFRSRLTILVAGELYRAIGKKIEKNGYNVLQGRTYLTWKEKLLTAIGCSIKLFSPNFWFCKHPPLNIIYGANT